MGADAIHFVEHAFGLAVKVALDSERGEFVRHHAHCPAGRVTLRLGAILVGTIGLNFRRGLAFVSVAKRAKAALHLYRFAGKVSGAFGAVGGNNYPAADDGVFSEFGQKIGSSTRCHPGNSFYDEIEAF